MNPGPLLTALGALSVGALLLLSAHAQFSSGIKTKNFTYTEFYDQPISATNPTNRLKLLLRGAQGRYLSNNLAAITTARLEHFPPTGRGTNLIAITPFCVLDLDAHSVSSTNRMDIAVDDGKLTVRGDTGFHFEMTNYILHVSNRTRTVLRQGLMNMTNR